MKVDLLQQVLFSTCAQYDPVPSHVHKKIGYHLIEFAVNYKNADGQYASHDTINSYTVQSTFNSWVFLLKLTEGPIFASLKGRNILSKEEVCKLLQSTACDPSTLGGYLNRFIVIVGICLVSKGYLDGLI